MAIWDSQAERCSSQADSWSSITPAAAATPPAALDSGGGGGAAAADAAAASGGALVVVVVLLLLSLGVTAALVSCCPARSAKQSRGTGRLGARSGAAVAVECNFVKHTAAKT